MIEKYYKLKYKIYIMWISLRWIRKTCLGDIVIYKGEEYFISNGASPYSWTLQQPNFGKRIENAPRIKCIKKKTFNNYFDSYILNYQLKLTQIFKYIMLNILSPILMMAGWFIIYYKILS